MNMFGMTWEEVFALLLSAMGPVGITMSYMPIAQALPPNMQRQLAWRTVLVGFLVAVGLMLLGGGVVQRFHLRLAVLIIDLGLLLLSIYVAQYLTKPILEVLQKIFGFILLTFGIQLVLQALAKLGIMTATGF